MDCSIAFVERGAGIVGRVGQVVNRNFDVEVGFNHAVVGFVDYLGELDAGRDHHPVKPAVEGVGGGAIIMIAVRYDNLLRVTCDFKREPKQWLTI